MDYQTSLLCLKRHLKSFKQEFVPQDSQACNIFDTLNNSANNSTEIVDLLAVHYD